jgi:tRNA modification GTPase
LIFSAFHHPIHFDYESFPMNDTIVALASCGLSKSAVAVIRVSGPHVRFILESLCRSVPAPRVMKFVKLRTTDGDALDHALVVFFPCPHSFTGEDCAEFHVHGGKAIVARLLSTLSHFQGVRLAKPGEFTQRAFIHGKLNLAQVEGLADVLDAETESQRKQALRQLDGVLGHKAAEWRQKLISALSYLEAHLDFSDEGDVPTHVHDEVNVCVIDVMLDLDAHIQAASYGEKIRDGYIVAILGPPNAGKSSLMNALVRRDVSLVSPFAGTTRDSIEVTCDLYGLPVTFIDTAGLRETEDPIESLGISRTRAKALQADLQLWLTPVDEPSEPDCDFVSPHLIKVFSKRDLIPKDKCASSFDLNDQFLYISIHDPETIDSLAKLIYNRLDRQCFPESGILTRERHTRSCVDAHTALSRVNVAMTSAQEELAVEDIRIAVRCLGSLIGTVGVEDILDRLFSSFCIGK